MRGLKWTLFGISALAIAAPLAFVADTAPAPAADHLDAPSRTEPGVDPNPDFAADIADVYAWYTPTSVIIAMTFAGPAAGEKAAVYDRDVLYTFNISNDFPRTEADFQINVRFGQDNAAGPNQYGVQYSNVPNGAGTTTTIQGPVETTLTSPGGVKTFAGLVDDPFFFDLQGFRASRTSNSFQFSNTRNFFKGKNDTGVILEIPRSYLQNGSEPLDIWGVSARFGGNI